MSSGRSEMFESEIEPIIFIILDVTGDLTGKKLCPSVYQLLARGPLNEKNKILGVAHRNLDD